MAKEASNILQEDALNQLTRVELQALGKAHNVKANLKSATIVAQLLKQFPDGVPNPKPGPTTLPRKKGRAKKGGAKKKEPQIKKEESVVVSAGGDEFDEPQTRTSALPSHISVAAAQEPTAEPIAQSTKKRASRAASRAHSPIVEPSLLTGPGRSPSRSSSVPTEIIPSPVQKTIIAFFAEPVKEKSSRRTPSQNQNQDEGSKIPPVEGDVVADNLSEVSDFTHNASDSSRGASPQPLANDSTLRYVIDIIKANKEKDQQTREEIKKLQERASNAKKLLQEQYYLLNAEREHRDRITTFFLYHVRNNNRWIAQSDDAQRLAPEDISRLVSNGGRGWKDTGEWEFGEVWSGPMVVSNSDIEITANNLEEYLRDIWDIHQRELAEGKIQANDSSADEPLAPPAPSAPVIDSSDSPETLSKKRKMASMVDSQPAPVEDSYRHAEKRQRLSHIPEGSHTAAPMFSPPPPITRRNKGKGRMSSLEVEQLQHELAREERIRTMRELDQDDSADAYEIQVALEDSLLRSAGERAMDG